VSVFFASSHKTAQNSDKNTAETWQKLTFYK